jgi:ATP-binding cassette subfamily C (CFTR/MRP) protein 1
VLFAIIAAVQGRHLDTETAFTTMAILSMVTHPANMVMTIVPRAIGTLAAFDRIQTFLLRPSLHDHRLVTDDRTKLIETQPDPAILIQNVTISTEQPILEDINLGIAPGSFVVISGPVGSGKSSLLRTILGEMTLSQGTIEILSRRIAYCGQRPWLPNGSIREAIQGPTEQVDDKWYQEVVERCCLSHDFNSLPDGDETIIGSRGLNLSGGQRQRVVNRPVSRLGLFD